MSRLLTVASSCAVSIARLGAGYHVKHASEPPAKPLELYEFEACPYCRKVRETLTELDLDAVVYPCPKGGVRFRPTVQEKTGKTQFPYLVDSNTDKALLESGDIVRYLTTTFGGKAPLVQRMGPLQGLASLFAFLARPGGMRARPSRQPEQMLELWSFEASPYCRIVREALSVLEIPYHLHNVATGSPKRAAFVARSGKMMVPFLSDPNTGRDMFESADIVAYLEATYGG